jgi:hypothetical protein
MFKPAALSQIRFGWLCAAYEPEFYFWEIIEFLRKFILSSVVIFYSPGSTIQIVAGALICTIFLFAASLFKPFQAEAEDAMTQVSFLCLVCTLMLGMALKIRDYEVVQGADEQGVIFAWLLFVVNIALFIFMLGIGLFEFNEDSQVKVDAINEMRRQNKDLGLIPAIGVKQIIRPGSPTGSV